MVKKYLQDEGMPSSNMVCHLFHNELQYQCCVFKEVELEDDWLQWFLKLLFSSMLKSLFLSMGVIERLGEVKRAEKPLWGMEM